MTTEQTIDRQLAAWIDQATTPVPEDLLSRSLARVDSTGQRPGWRVGGRISLPTFGRRAVVIPAWGVVLIALLVAGAVVIGASQLLKDVPTVVVDPSPSPTDQPAHTPQPTPAPTAGILGGRPIMAIARDVTALGPVELFLLDAASGERTALGTLPGRAFDYEAPPRYTFTRSADGGHVIIDGGRGQGQVVSDITAAGQAFDFYAFDTLVSRCCDGGYLEEVTFSPGGDRIAGVRASGFDVPIEVLVEDIDGGNPVHLPLPQGMNSFGGLSWAPDGSALVGVGCRPCNQAETPGETQTEHHGRLYIVPLDGSPWQELLDVDNGQPNPWFLPDGSTLLVSVTTCGTGQFMPRCDPLDDTAWIGTVDVASGQTTKLRDTDGLLWIHLSPDGARAVFSADDGTFVRRLDNGTEVQLDVPGVQPDIPDGALLEWSPDSQWLMYGDGDWASWIVPADGSAPPRRLATDVSGATW